MPKTLNMKIYLKRNVSLLILFATASGLQPQSIDNSLLSSGLECRKNRDYAKGLSIFQTLLRSDSNDVGLLTNSSFFYTKCGYNLENKNEQMKYYSQARYLALRAISLNRSSADARYTYALALSHLCISLDIRGRLKYVPQIRRSLDAAIKLDSGHAGAHHLLGRFHNLFAGLNFLQKATIACLGVTEAEGSFEEAIDYFIKAIRLEPAYKMHYVALAETYKNMGRDGSCRLWSLTALSKKSKCGDDLVADSIAHSLLRTCEKQ
jgi:tetratricopeptide (TPR) repeat protein